MCFPVTDTTTPLSTPTSTATTSPFSGGGGTSGSVGVAGGEITRKSNWQVIEHFGSKDKGSLSSSLIAVSFDLCIKAWPFIDLLKWIILFEVLFCTDRKLLFYAIVPLQNIFIKRLFAQSFFVKILTKIFEFKKIPNISQLYSYFNKRRTFFWL